MEAYKQILKEEVEVLRKKGKAFLAGDISRNELKGFSGGLGSYSQRETGKFMIRLFDGFWMMPGRMVRIKSI